MARLLIALAVLLVSTANARTLKCRESERPWLGQVGAKRILCCVDDGRGPYPQSDLHARCRLGKRQWKQLFIGPDGRGWLARSPRWTRYSEFGVTARPRCTVTVDAACGGPVAGTISCKHLISPFTLAPEGEPLTAPTPCVLDPCLSCPTSQCQADGITCEVLTENTACGPLAVTGVPGSRSQAGVLTCATGSDTFRIDWPGATPVVSGDCTGTYHIATGLEPDGPLIVTCPVCCPNGTDLVP